MKIALILSLVAVVFLSLSFTGKEHWLLGKWERYVNTKDGQIHQLMYFKADGSTDFFINKKFFGTEKFRVDNDTLLVTCAGNSAYYAKYGLTLYGKQDSIMVIAIADTCGGRAEAMHRRVFKRVKNK